jgi:phosphopantetheinyl transferase
VEKASLLHAPVAPGLRPACATRLLETLPYAHRLRLERADPSARASSLAGLALALIAANQNQGAPFVGVADLRLREEEKPRFVRGPHFSISHTRSRVACVACASVEVGLDIESAPSDLARASTLKVLQWTATEATLKAGGVGLRHVPGVRIDLSSLASEFGGRRYVLRELVLAPDTLGHVASTQPLVLDMDCVALDHAQVSGALERILGLAPQGSQ